MNRVPERQTAGMALTVEAQGKLALTYRYHVETWEEAEALATADYRQLFGLDASVALSVTRKDDAKWPSWLQPGSDRPPGTRS